MSEKSRNSRSVTNVKISEIYCTFYSDMHHCLCCRAGSSAVWELRQRLWMIPAKKRICPWDRLLIAIPVKLKEAAVGDSILYQTDSKAYRYMITEMDKKNHIFKVIDSSDKDAEPVAVEVKDYIPKVVITVGYAGYLLLATESIEGLIILGLCRPFPGNSVYSCGTSEKRTAG